MRSIKELLELMLKNEQGYFNGLCNWVHNLYLSKIINLEEKLLLNRYIRNNRPLKMSIRSYDENEQRLINKGRLDMLDDIDKLLNHNVLHINRDELNHILNCKFLFEHDNTLCIQTGSDDMYWIKFDEKGVNK
jgi:uncharacterized membrane-anchored protein YjiN (DUF445 family)